MHISGFTYLRNGFRFGYPFLASIKSILPIVDEFIVVVGDSDDGTREAIAAINNKKIKIIDSIWDETLRENGKIFAQQSDIGLKHCSGDWAFHLQVDEVLHENDQQKIRDAIKHANTNPKIEGLLFPFLHFWGDYNYIRNTRRVHRFEIRAFKNSKNITPYKDSQGFRNYIKNPEGEKLNVIKVDAPVFHYSYTRHPNLMKQKTNYFHRFWHNDNWLKENTDQQEFDYNQVDRLEKFAGSHPIYMKEIIRNKDWKFEYEPSKSNMKFTDRILNGFEKYTGIRLFEYRNYKLVK